MVAATAVRDGAGIKRRQRQIEEEVPRAAPLA